MAEQLKIILYRNYKFKIYEIFFAMFLILGTIGVLFFTTYSIVELIIKVLVVLLLIALLCVDIYLIKTEPNIKVFNDKIVIYSPFNYINKVIFKSDILNIKETENSDEQYGVKTNRAEQETHMNYDPRIHEGLFYDILLENGKKISIPFESKEDAQKIIDWKIGNI